MDGSLLASFGEALLVGVLAMVVNLINLFLAPIDMVLSTMLPESSTFINNYVVPFLNLSKTALAWVCDFLMIEPAVFGLIILTLIFSVTATHTVRGFKLVIQWISKFK